MNAKKAAAAKAVTYIKDGMTLGLGTGSTAAFAIELIGQMVRNGLVVEAAASSVQSAKQAMDVGIKLIKFSNVHRLDLYIDGADEVDRDLNLIKGGGGALLREKILAFNSKQFIVIVDDTKLVDRLGKFPLPVELTPFANDLTKKNLEKLGCTTRFRMENGAPFITDNGNLIVDCNFDRIADPEELHRLIKKIPGVVEHGLFSNTLTGKVIVGYENGDTKELEGTRGL